MWGSNEFSTSAVWVDYDKDGKLDLIVSNYVQWSADKDIYCTIDGSHKSYCTPESYKGATARVWRNLGNGKFEDATQKSRLFDTTSKSLGVTILDYDNDGWPDILIANGHVYPEVSETGEESGYRERKVLYRNLGNGKFEDVSTAAGPGIVEKVPGRGCALGDGAAELEKQYAILLDKSPFRDKLVMLFELFTPGDGSLTHLQCFEKSVRFVQGLQG
jgi:hypothetical protein